MQESEATDPMREFVRELTEAQQELRSFVGYLMVGTESAADVVQEVNLLLWEKRKQFEPGTNFRAWAFTMARYVALGHRRRLRKDGVLVFDPDLVDRLADDWQAEPPQHSRKLAALEICFDKLANDDQALLKARYAGHGQVERMAMDSGRSGSGLRARLFRLRAALKQCVQHELEMEGELS